MTDAAQWLRAVWRSVRPRLPDPPARVVEIGCGPLGGFVPMLGAEGYEVVGVDPEAPEGELFRREQFERAGPFEAVDAVVASTSLHHVADPEEVVARIASVLKHDGTLMVVEWAWERFDRPTADWCFERLGPDADPGWLHRRRDEWAASHRPWEAYLSEWAEREGIHRFDVLLQLIEDRFHRQSLDGGAYFFPDLAGTTEADELAAIDAGLIAATRMDCVGRRR
jgi:SAM-dependent methyltransferase